MKAEQENSPNYALRVRNFTELIQSITVDVVVDQSRIPASKIQTARTVLQRLLRGTLPVAARLRLEALPMATVNRDKEDIKKEIVSQVDEKLEKLRKDQQEALASRDLASLEKKTTLIDTISEFKDVIATLLASFLLFILGILAQGTYRKIQEKRMKMEEALAFRSAGSESNISIEGVSNSSTLNSPTVHAESDAQNGGFQQLSSIIDQSPERAAYLIKQWLYSEDVKIREILTLIPRQIKFDQLNQLIALLNQEDRKRWNQINSLHLQPGALPHVDQLVAQKIADHLIEPNVDISEDTKQLIASMTPQEGVTAIRADAAFGALLASAMPSLQYSRVLSLLDTASIRAVADRSFEIGPKDLQYLAVKLVKTLEQMRGESRSKRTLFTEKIPQLIQELGYEKEVALFDSLASTGDLDLLMKTSRDFFPSELIDELPSEILKEALDSMELAKKAELIASQPERSLLLFEALGEGRLRQVLEVEISDINSNPVRLRKVQRQASGLWQLFIDQIRRKIRNNQDLQEDLDQILNQWSVKKINTLRSKGANGDVA